MKFRFNLRDPSVWVLLLGNLVPLYGVFFLGWTPLSVVWIYVLETVIVGLYNILALMMVGVDVMGTGRRPKARVGLGARLGVPVFFVFHYGMFVTVQSIVILLAFSMTGSHHHLNGLANKSEAGIAFVLNPTGAEDQYLAVLGLVISHGFSFVFHYLMRGENLVLSQEQVMMRPYRRIVIQQLVAILGTWLALAAGMPQAVLALFVCLKIGADVWAHNKKHKVQTETT